MQIAQEQIQAHNQAQQAAHQRKIDFIAAENANIESIIEKLVAFQVAIPSWALGTGGTRFGRFSGGGEPRNLEEKIEIHISNNHQEEIKLLKSKYEANQSIQISYAWKSKEDNA